MRKKALPVLTLVWLMLYLAGCGGQKEVTVVVTPTPGLIAVPIIQTVVVTPTSAPTLAPIIQTVVVTPTPAPTLAPIIQTVVMTPTPGPTAPPVIQTVVVTATPGPTPTPIIQTIVVTATPEPTPTPTIVVPMSDEMSMPEAMPHLPELQEIGLIENYAANEYFPNNIVVLKDIPVRIYLTRIHREHVNLFTIDPFYSSTKVILPGKVGTIDFTPDQAGEFKIRNVGHGNQADLIVVETQQELMEHIAGRERQMYSIIHDVDEFRMFPDRLTVQKDIPVTIHNISLVAEHQVSIEPYYVAEEINVRPREIMRFEFTPDTVGEFTILHELHGFTGTLVVEEGMATLGTNP